MEQIRKFIVPDNREAIAIVKREMGPDAVILKIAKVKGQGGAPALEVTASLSAKHKEEAERGRRRAEETAPPAATAAPSAAAAPSAEPRPELNGIITELNEITRRLAEIQQVLQPELLAARLDGMTEGLGALQRMVAENRDNGNGHGRPVFDHELGELYDKLVLSGMDEAFAQEAVDTTSRRLSSRSLSPATYGVEYLAATLMEQVRTVSPFEPGRGRRVHMIVGPTGVGKTTTIAKLAAEQVFNMNRKACLLTVDTFRIGAVDQLRTYARILDVPLVVCMNEVELVEAVERNRDKDVLFIDTAGASQKDARMMGELAKFQQSGVPMDVHLIVSATTTDEDLADIAVRYDVVPISSLIVSKLDEANSFGNVYNLMRQTRIPLSYFTVGQHVPDDIEEATPERVVDLLLDVSSRL